MKKIYFLLCAFLMVSSINAQTITFGSAAFKDALLAAGTTNAYAQDVNGNNMNIDANNNNEIEVAEAANVYKLNVGGWSSVAIIYNIIGIEYFVNLRVLDVYGSRISGTDLSVLPHLEELYCNNIGVRTIPSGIILTGLNLKVLECYWSNALSNYLTGTDGNGGLAQFPNLKRLVCSGASGPSQLTSLNLTGCSNLEYLSCMNNLLTTLDLTGLTHLTELDCSKNKLTTLNFSGLNSLVTVNASTNKFTSFTLTGAQSLQSLDLSSNTLMTSMTASNLNSLKTLKVQTCALNTLTLTGTPLLESLACQTNQLASLNLAAHTHLVSITCNTNQLTSLELTGLTNLTTLECYNNQITMLDVSSCTTLSRISCYNNNLNSLFIKNGVYNGSSTFTSFSNNPNLQFVCCDDDELTYIQSLANTTTNVNSYCSFVPGGTYYTMQGSNRFDNNNNGCDAADLMFKNLRLKITSDVSGYAISNNLGNYSLPLLAGTYTITPQIENAGYFITTPYSRTVTFPSTASPVTQDFCFRPNGSLSDIGIYIFPMQSARPGFDATYRIIYKNKGNVVQSGAVNLSFDDALLNYVSAIPAVTNQSPNMLSWNYINLFPFETREIYLTLHVNAPTDTPPVSGGTLLAFEASITDDGADLQIEDNTDSYNQYAVNSFDPNDKTCMEGATITPEMVGKDVTYMIRFENTGTANAENIVVKDMIDTTKFDINTLIPISGSHPFETRISKTNKVEFIFENINLPFDDANNDGYVAFKIKTKPSLVLGNTFSNTASIYFDYNFPIITNTATTTVSLLANQDFDFESYFKIYPNPAKDVLNIETKKTIEVTSINIYNTLGQIVLVIPNAQQTKTVDVSGLKTGNYFLKILSEKGSSSVKFVKQ